MRDRIKALFEKAGSSGAQELDRNNELQLAAAALLVESASIDGNFDKDERQSISKLLVSHFKLSASETEILIDRAELVVKESGQLFGFSKVVKDEYDEHDRVNIIEMLWEVAFADGNVDEFEKNLIQRVAGLIFVSDKDRGLARKRVMARLGISV